MHETEPKTVGELRAILSRFEDADPIQFMSHDGPDYGWLEVGGEWINGYLHGKVTLGNER